MKNLCSLKICRASRGPVVNYVSPTSCKPSMRPDHVESGAIHVFHVSRTLIGSFVIVSVPVCHEM